MNRSGQFWLAASMVSLLTACATPPDHKVVECSAPAKSGRAPGPALVGASYGMEMTPIPLDAIQFTNAALWQQVAVQQVSASRTATDRVEVVARLVNCTDKVVIISARTSFMDERTAPTEPISAWQRVFIQPRSTALYSEKSISPDRVRHYLIEVAPNL